MKALSGFLMSDLIVAMVPQVFRFLSEQVLAALANTLSTIARAKFHRMRLRQPPGRVSSKTRFEARRVIESGGGQAIPAGHGPPIHQEAEPNREFWRPLRKNYRQANSSTVLEWSEPADFAVHHLRRIWPGRRSRLVLNLIPRPHKCKVRFFAVATSSLHPWLVQSILRPSSARTSWISNRRLRSRSSGMRLSMKVFETSRIPEVTGRTSCSRVEG